jgi:enoyl reductase-like protein
MEKEIKTIQDVKNEAVAILGVFGAKIGQGEKPNAVEMIEQIVELSARAHEESTRIEKRRERDCTCTDYEGCGCWVACYNKAIEEINEKSKQFFEE